MTEDRLKQIERKLGDAIRAVEGGFTYQTTEEWAALEELVAEVRRLRELERRLDLAEDYRREQQERE